MSSSPSPSPSHSHHPLTTPTEAAATHMVHHTNAPRNEREAPSSSLTPSAITSDLRSAGPLDEGAVRATLTAATFNLSMVESFGLGGLAGAVSKTVIAPVERTRLLVSVPAGGSLSNYSISWWLEFATRIRVEEGLLAFWRGNILNVARYAPSQATAFMFYETYKQYLQPHGPTFTQSLFGHMAAGGAAGATSLLILYPIDSARTRRMMDYQVPRQFHSTIDCVIKTFRSSGLVGVYNGFVVSWLGTIVHRAAYFGLYHTIIQMDINRERGFFFKFGVGFFATLAGGFLSSPFNTIRRRMTQTIRTVSPDRKTIHYSPGADRYKGSMDCCRQLIRKEGIKSLFKSSLLAPIGGSLTLVVFDYLKDWYLEWRYPARTPYNCQWR